MGDDKGAFPPPTGQVFYLYKMYEKLHFGPKCHLILLKHFLRLGNSPVNEMFYVKNFESFGASQTEGFTLVRLYLTVTMKTK